jgi:hypothetical protein
VKRRKAKRYAAVPREKRPADSRLDVTYSPARARTASNVASPLPFREPRKG